MSKIAALFPGQGSQSVGMGKDLYDNFPEVKELFEKADEALGYSLSALCFDGPIETLTLTENAQPALLVCGYAAYLAAGITPAAAAGHSLGEYTALVAAGVLDFADAVQLVNKRGKYMQQAVPEGEGKMLAVIGSKDEDIENVIKASITDSAPDGVIEIANLNCPGQTVVAGNVSGVDTFATKMEAQGAKVIPLQVSAPFHCSLMQAAAEQLANDLDATEFSNPSFPVYANVTAKKIDSGDQARELLKEQVCATVRWTDSMVNLVESEAIEEIVEFGPGGVLSKLMKRINKTIVRTEIFDSSSIEKTKS